MTFFFSPSVSVMFGLVMTAIVLTAKTCGSAGIRDSLPQTHNINNTTGASSSAQGEWHTPTYNGLILGQSTKSDVERIFGKPIWSGLPEEELIDDDEDELLYEYKNVGNVIGQLTVVLGARSKLVKAVDIYPQQSITIRQIVEQYGDKYIERESELGPCPTEMELRNFKPSPKREYPIFRVYPQLGMYIAISSDNTVSHIGYLARCPN